MNVKTTLMLAVVCLLGAVALLLVKPWAPAGVDSKEEQAADLAVFDPKPEGIDRVEWIRRDGKQIVFVRSGKEDWAIDEPLKAPASRWEVEGIVNALTGLNYTKEFAAGSSDRPSEAISGLDKPQAVYKLMKEGKTLAELRVGSRPPTGGGQYVQRSGSDAIFLTKEDLSTHLRKKVEDLRDKRVLNFSMDNVKRVKAEGIQNFELVRADDKGWLLESPMRARADKTEAENAVRPLTSLTVEEFKDDEPFSYKPYGLEPPRLKLTVETEEEVPAKAKPGDPNTQPADTQPTKETKSYELMIGGAVDTKAESYFARIGSAPWVFAIRKATVDSLAPEASRLRDKAIATVDTTKVIEVQADTPGGGMILNRAQGSKWFYADKTEADATLVEDLLRAVRDLKATEYLDPQNSLLTLDWDKPRAKIVLTVEGALNPVTVLVGPPTASGRMVYVRNPAEDGVAAVHEDNVAQLLQPPIAYRFRTVMTFEKDRAERIEIARPGGPAVELVNKDNLFWLMSAPVNAEADADAVRNLLTNVASLPAKRVVGSGNKAEFGLDQPQLSLAVWLPAEKVESATLPAPATQPEAVSSQPTAEMTPEERQKQIDTINQLLEFQKTNKEENPVATQMLQDRLAELLASVGQTGTTQPATAAAPPAPAATAPEPKVYRLDLAQKNGATYASVPGEEMVYELENRVFEDVAAEMHKRQLTRFTIDDVVEIGFRKANGSTITFQKAGDEWKYVEDPMVPIDKQKVVDVLNVFRELRTHRYVDYAPADLGAYGLTDQTDRVIIGLKTGQRTEIVLSGKGPEGDPDKSQYATIEGTKGVFLLKGEQAAKFQQQLEDFEKKASSPTP